MNFILGLAVEHQKTLICGGSSRTNWSAVLEITNLFFLQIPDFAQKYLNGLESTDKMKTHWGDRSRAYAVRVTEHRDAAWELQYALCTLEEHQPLAL